MSKAKTATSPKLDAPAATNSALATIINRLAGLTEDGYVAPIHKPGGRDIMVGLMPDHLRRIHTLVCQITNEHNVLGREAQELLGKIDNAKTHGGGGLKSLVHILRGGLTAEFVENLQTKLVELLMLKHMLELVSQLMWQEIRTAFPELVDKSNIGVYDDWKVGYHEKEDEDHVEKIFKKAVESVGGARILGMDEFLADLDRMGEEA